MKLLSHGPEPCASANSAISAIIARFSTSVAMVHFLRTVVKHIFLRKSTKIDATRLDGLMTQTCCKPRKTNVNTEACLDRGKTKTGRGLLSGTSGSGILLLGRGDATRTRNKRFWRPWLYQLNYSPSRKQARLYTLTKIASSTFFAECRTVGLSDVHVGRPAARLHRRTIAGRPGCTAGRPGCTAGRRMLPLLPVTQLGEVWTVGAAGALGRKQVRWCRGGNSGTQQGEVCSGLQRFQGFS